MHFCTGSARHASAYLSASSSGRLVRTGRSQIPATFFGHNHPRSSIPRCYGNYTCPLLENFVPRWDQRVSIWQIPQVSSSRPGRTNTVNSIEC